MTGLSPTAKVARPQPIETAIFEPAESRQRSWSNHPTDRQLSSRKATDGSRRQPR